MQSQHRQQSSASQLFGMLLTSLAFACAPASAAPPTRAPEKASRPAEPHQPAPRPATQESPPKPNATSGADAPLRYTASIELELEIGRGVDQELDTYVENLVVDEAKNVLVSVSAVTGSTLAGTAVLGPKGLSQLGLAKLSPNGQTLWTHQVAASGGAGPSALAADGQGGVYVAGWSRGPISGLAARTLPARGERDAFVTRLASDGKVLWSRVLGGALTDTIEALAVDAAGNVAVAGTFYKSADFGSGIVQASGTPSLFVALYGADSRLHWAKPFNVKRASSVNATPGWPGASLAFDAAGHLFVAGRFNGTLELGDASLRVSGETVVPVCRTVLAPPRSPTASRPAEGAFLIELAANGEVVRARAFSSDGGDTNATGLGRSPQGFLLSGRYSVPLAMGSRTLTPPVPPAADCGCDPACRSRQQGLFVAQLDATGTPTAALSTSGTSVYALLGPSDLPLVVSRQIAPSASGRPHQLDVLLQLHDWQQHVLWQDSVELAYPARSGGATTVDAQGNPLISWTDVSTHRVWLRKYQLTRE